jgi:hypothetical protein
MTKFRKKPVEIEARLFDPHADYDEALDVLAWAGAEATHFGGSIPTLEGPMTVSPGDWVIRGVAGEFYPCKPEIFAATYEAVA